MALITWGALIKSIFENKTIATYIYEMIAAHEADPDAHLSATGSLQSHKASEIIDHLALSIVTDKLEEHSVTVEKTSIAGKLVLQPLFDTLDAWYSLKEGTGANITAKVGYLDLEAGTVVGDKTILAANNWDRIFIATTDKNPFFRSLIQAEEKDYCDIIFGYGSQTPFSPTGLIAFKWDKTDAKLYAYTIASGFAAQSVEITGIDINDLHEYTIEVLDLGSTINFYIDNVLKTTVSRAGFSIDSDIGPVFAIQNDEAGENPDVWFGNFYLYQDK